MRAIQQQSGHKSLATQGAAFIGAGAGLAAASNGDKGLLGGGIAMAVAGLASAIASGVVLAQRKKARYQQALAGCPVIAK